MGSVKADMIVWDKVCNAINNPDVILGDARLQIAQLRQQAETIIEDQERIQDTFDALVMERQTVITWARKGSITDEDLEYQLGALKLQEMALKKELAAYSEIGNLAALDDWERAADEYFLDLQAGIEWLNNIPQGEEDKNEIFQFKRDIIKALVNRVTIDKRRELRVEIRLDVLEILRQTAKADFSEVQQVGICTRIYDSVRGLIFNILIE